MSSSVFLRPGHRPTPGALYMSTVGAFAVLLLALSVSGLVAPLAVVVVAVPLGPIGVVVGGLALPALAAPPSLAFAAIVLAVVLAIGAVNVMIGALVAAGANRRLDDLRARALTSPLGGSSEA